MARAPLTFEIRRLDPLDPQEEAAADALLMEAKASLVRPNEHLEPISERSVDPARILLVACGEGRAIVGLVDAVPHHPAPGGLAIAAIVVRSEGRRRGAA